MRFHDNSETSFGSAGGPKLSVSDSSHLGDSISSSNALYIQADLAKVDLRFVYSSEWRWPKLPLTRIWLSSLFLDDPSFHFASSCGSKQNGMIYVAPIVSANATSKRWLSSCVGMSCGSASTPFGDGMDLQCLVNSYRNAVVDGSAIAATENCSARSWNSSQEEHLWDADAGQSSVRGFVAVAIPPNSPWLCRSESERRDGVFRALQRTGDSASGISASSTSSVHQWNGVPISYHGPVLGPGFKGMERISRFMSQGTIAS